MEQVHTNQPTHKSPTDTPSRDLFIKGQWDPETIRKFIDARSQQGRTPSHLILGKREAQLLQSHLKETQPDADTSKLEGSTYMGLKIQLHGCGSLLRLAGDLYMGHLSRTGRHREPIEESTSWWRAAS